nr:hypothetical protein [Akkermansia muciniphila]
MLEMEWTHAYANKTPKAEDFRNAMLAAGLQQCPADFQEAWLRQTARPGRNYAAPVLRKYGVRLKDLRERLQGKLFKINLGCIRPFPFTTKMNKFHAWIRAHAETPRLSWKPWPPCAPDHGPHPGPAGPGQTVH